MTDLDLIRLNLPAGRQLLAYIEARCESLRNECVAPLLDERQADTIRGRLAELKRLRGLMQDAGEQGNA